MQRLYDFVPKSYVLRSIRTRANQTLVKSDRLLVQMYQADMKDGRPSIAPVTPSFWIVKNSDTPGPYGRKRHCLRAEVTSAACCLGCFLPSVLS